MSASAKRIVAAVTKGAAWDAEDGAGLAIGDWTDAINIELKRIRDEVLTIAQFCDQRSEHAAANSLYKLAKDL